MIASLSLGRVRAAGCRQLEVQAVGLRFYRRVKVLPGVSVNVSKSGPSVSFGGLGGHVTIGRNGVTRSVGIPGTGIYYTSRQGYHTGVHSSRESGISWGWIIAIILFGLIAMMARAR